MRPTLLLYSLSALALLIPVTGSGGASDELLYGTEGNRLRRYDVDTIGTTRLAEEILIDRASVGETGGTPSDGPGRDVNGMICFFPDGSGRFVLGEDSDQPNPRAGWGVFDAAGNQIGKLTATYQIAGAEPFGCAFDPATGALYTTSVGAQGFGLNSGQLIKWFPPFDHFPGPPGTYPTGDPTSTNFCKIVIDIGTAAGVAVDPQGRVWSASSSDLRVDRFTLPSDKSLEPGVPGEGCEDTDPQGSPIVDASVSGLPNFRETVIQPDPSNLMFTFTGLALAYDAGSDTHSIYAASVLTGRIAEYDLDGNFIRFIVDHPLPGFGGAWTLPQPFGTPQGISIGADGTVYYADLDLVGALPNVGPGPDGKVWRVRFDANGDPLPPEQIRDDLAFPDGVAVAPGNLQQTEWLTLAGSAQRQFANQEESVLTAANVAQLVPRWAVPTAGAVTASPTVAAVDIPGSGLTQVAYIQSWDLNLYAVRLDDGALLWSLATEDQPGASYPGVASVHVVKVDNVDRVIVGQGEILYSLDAVTGEEAWRFTAGTGCRDANGDPPGLCGFDGERNQIESSAYVAGGLAFFGMDINDVPGGKGGFYAVDVRDGSLAWFFDLESGQTCKPMPGEKIYQYDGYHSEAELNLPPGFLSRPECSHPRTPNGCGNVWSSPAVDLAREALFIASSNCDTPIDPVTMLPETMPPFDEAIFSLSYEGEVRWVWRPRRADNEDLAFGAVPNLFHIQDSAGGGAAPAGAGGWIDVVGIGGKDGSYYVLDRDGVNQRNGAAWDSDPASHLPADLPYWSTNVVAGGAIGGIIATSAVDEVERRIHFSTAIGEDTELKVHALDMDTGAVLWQTSTDPSFGPTSLIPGLVFTGFINSAQLRMWDAATGNPLSSLMVLSNVAVASGAVVVDGALLVGAGIGTRTQSGSDPGDVVANLPSALSAFCVAGTTGCAACNDGIDNDLDGMTDAGEDMGCVDDQDNSEVLGDTNYDNRVDERDQPRMLAAFGRSNGQPGYVKAADLHPPGAPDGVVDLVDWQRWLQAEAAARMGCGLLGIEPVLLLAGVAALRRRRGRRRSQLGQRAERRAWSGWLAGAALLLLIGHAPQASALVTLSYDLAPGTVVEAGRVIVGVGQSFQVDVLGDLSEPIVGWGLDANTDASKLLLSDVSVGSAWLPVGSADGDGLAGLAGLPGVSGNAVLIATLTFEGLTAGLTDLLLGVTPGDNSEGFALVQPGSFDNVVFPPALGVTVVPEPASAGLLALGLLALTAAARRSSGTR